MSDEWIPGGRSIPGAHSGGTLIGGPRRVTWHITWDKLDPRPTFDQVGAYLVSVNFEPTILWNPEDGDIIQFLSGRRSAYAVRNLAGGVETNKMGDVHVQIEVFFSPGYKNRAVFTDGPLVGLDRIMSWLDVLGVPRTAAGDFAHPVRDSNVWKNVPGHYGHSMVPENDHTDPGPIDMAKILATGIPVPSEDTVIYTYVQKPNDPTVWAARHGETPIHVGVVRPDGTTFGFEDLEALVGYQGDSVKHDVGANVTDAKGIVRKVLPLTTPQAVEWFGLP